MPTLKRLEIIGCEMMRFHDMAPFYRDIANVQKAHGTNINIEISPLRETGTRWENISSPFSIRDHRSGEYVVCWADVGVKIPSAVAVEAYWQLFPAMVGKLESTLQRVHWPRINMLTHVTFAEAGQWETIFDLTSATRQYLERLPMPNMAIPILIRIFSDYMDIQKSIEQAEAKWAAQQPASIPSPPAGNAGGNARGNRQRQTNREALATPNPCPEIYDPHHWPSGLRRKVTKFMVKRNHALAFAMFGTERWIETADRNEMSTNTQCRTDNYAIWAVDKKCFQCEIRLPMIAFTGGGLCENCRLKNACEDEDDHLKQMKKNATRAFGFHTPPSTPEEPLNGQMGTQSVQVSNQGSQAAPESEENQPQAGIRDITHSNFPKPEAFWREDGGNRVSVVNCPRDLAQILSDPDGPLATFFLEALRMDMLEAKHGPIGHIGFKQKKHGSGESLELNKSSRQMAGHYMYRRSLSIEEFMKTPNGLTATDVQRFRGGF